MPPFFSITTATHERLAAHLRPGDRAIDATCGHGRDTLALARLVGPGGHVLAIDRQAVAIAATRSALASNGAGAGGPGVELVEGDHATVLAARARTAPASVRLVLFNLGYLPGGDKAITTTTAATLRALAAAWACLAGGGALAVVCYPGHPEGAREAAAVEAWVGERARLHARMPERLDPGLTRRPAPFLLWLEKPARANP